MQTKYEIWTGFFVWVISVIVSMYGYYNMNDFFYIGLAMYFISMVYILIKLTHLWRKKK